MRMVLDIAVLVFAITMMSDAAYEKAAASVLIYWHAQKLIHEHF